MKEAGELASSWTVAAEEALQMRDVIMFAFKANRTRKSQGKTAWVKAAPSGEVLLQLQRAIIRFLSDGLYTYINGKYQDLRDVTKAPPARRTSTGSNRTSMPVENIWTVLDHAQTTGKNVRQALQFCKSTLSDAGGCHENAAEAWVRRRQIIDDQRVVASMVGANHFNVVADTSKHSGREVLVSVIWSHENQTAAIPSVQSILPCDTLVSPGELDLTTLENKIQRLAAYRQLQAISHQLYLSSGGGFTLDSFQIPAALRIKGAQAGETRFSRIEVSESGIRKVVAGFQSEDKEDELCLPSDLNWWKSIPLLTLQMDQGVWSRVLKAATDRQRAEELVHFCYTTLLLRYPSEPTYATWTALLGSFEPDCSSFDLRSKYETVKNVWHAAKVRLARTNPMPANLLSKLPLSFDELAADMQAAYGDARPLAEWPVSTQEEEKKDSVHKLADAIIQRLDKGGRRRSEEDLLPGLKIFSPMKRTGNGALVAPEKRKQLAALSSGQGAGTSRSEPARFLSLTDEHVPPRTSTDSDAVLSMAPAVQKADPPLAHVDAGSSDLVRRGAGGLEERLSKRLCVDGPMQGISSPTRQDKITVDGSQPSHDACGSVLVPAGQATAKNQVESCGDLAGQFMKARKTEQKPKNATSTSAKASKKKPAASASAKLKRPAGCFKRPAAKKEQAGEVSCLAEVKEYKNTTFDAKKYGKCKVEYYTHKSYIRHFQEKWAMIVGSTHTNHKYVCDKLVPHVKKGISREELLRIRGCIIQQLAD
eukprot:s464_g38.t1